jgi:hypothetical protein
MIPAETEFEFCSQHFYIFTISSYTNLFQLTVYNVLGLAPDKKPVWVRGTRINQFGLGRKNKAVTTQ